ncbi:MAG: N-acetylmuramoyl-L-alanine amidase [Chthoniobacteraceae bacterium]
MINFSFFVKNRRWHSALLVLALVAVSGFLTGCASLRYYNVTDFDTVVVDPGHGGHDSGASSRGRPRLLEKDVALDVGRRVGAKLRDAGFRVVMTRKDDTFIPLDQRAECSNTYRKSVFVSIHFNDSVRRGPHGAEVYHNRQGTWELAGRIEDFLSAMPGSERRGVKTARYRVLRKSEGPALLVECAFLSNPGDAKRAASAAWREEAASRIARAIILQRRQ